MKAGLARATRALILLPLLGCDDEPKGKTEATSREPPTSLSAVASAAPASTSAAPPATSAAPAPAPPEAVAAQHVLVAYKGAKGADRKITRSKADAKKRAAEVVKKAKGGAEFSALVAEYSDDPGSKERQGSVGKFTREKMTKPFSDAAFALPVDGVSDVVESDFGFHVIKRNQ